MTPPSSRAAYATVFPLMGGWASVEFLFDSGRREAERIAVRLETEARRIEAKFSRYREASVVSEINRNAGRTPVAVDEETDRLVGEALALSELTGGRFDPTVGPLRRAWDFRSGRVPTPEEIDSLLPLVDARAVSRRNRTVFLRREGMEIDLGGVGKEYAVDRAAEILRDGGVRAATVDFAGDVCTVGSRLDGRPWAVAARDPRDPRKARFTVRVVGDAGIATSGDYERGFVRDGVRYHHILDARTGWPARGAASVTVVARATFDAGRYATAAFLLGPRSGMELLESASGIEGAMITEANEILATRGMAQLSDLPGGVYAACPAL